MGRTAVRRRVGARRATAVAVAALVACALTVGCGARPAPGHPDGQKASSPSPNPPSATSSMAVPLPGPLDRPQLTPDILIYSSRTLPTAVVDRIKRVRTVTDTLQYSMAQFYYQERGVRYGAVDPAAFRRWTESGTAVATDVWRRVADGEIAINPRLGHLIQDRRGYVRMGDSDKASRVHVGAYAQLFDPRFNDLGVDAVVNQKWVPRLGMVPDNAMLLTTGTGSPQKVIKQLRAIAGKDASVQILGFKFDPRAVHTAVLTGESVDAAVGTFNYTANAGGGVSIQSSWVSSYIRTVQVPIIGKVTCNKVMIPQLIAALTEIQQRGLAKYLNPSQYGGCYVPRFIAGTHTLSYHAFGLAVDLNVPGNQRGTSGEMNRQIVKIFNSWGFQWGGTWHYTDPMHFELHRIVRSSVG